MVSKILTRLIGLLVLIVLVVLAYVYIAVDKNEQISISFSLLSSNDKVNSNNESDASQQIETELESKPQIAENLEPLIDKPVSKKSQSKVINEDLIEKLLLSDEFMNKKIEINSNLEKSNEKPFVVQLVALRNQSKISALISNLKEQNYPVFSKYERNGEVLLTRLFIGPYESREEADKLINELEQLTQLKGIVITNGN